MASSSRSSRFWSLVSDARSVFPAAIALRALLLIYGIYQDSFSPVKYTDIDYYVFTDAARYVARGRSPYQRDTYRYTPLLAWLLYPTSWNGWWFHFGKALFAAGDVVSGWLIYLVLQSSQKLSSERALRFSSIWLLNPMVAQISTRGSSEGLLTVIVIALLWAVLGKRIKIAGFLLGFGVHFKIYPFIYATSAFLWLHSTDTGAFLPKSLGDAMKVLNRAQVELAIISFITFQAFNLLMYQSYGFPFIQHTFLHHVTRIDHRHNFSPYNMLLYLNSSPASRANSHLESVAFLPQIVLSTIAIPMALARKDLPSTMLAQTFAFVTFNKVCTSQYFLWYIVFLPFYLPHSRLLREPRAGFFALAVWILGQAFWLFQGWRLEFLGASSFAPALWLASIGFFLANTWVLGFIVDDVSTFNLARKTSPDSISKKEM